MHSSLLRALVKNKKRVPRGKKGGQGSRAWQGSQARARRDGRARRNMASATLGVDGAEEKSSAAAKRAEPVVAPMRSARGALAKPDTKQHKQKQRAYVFVEIECELFNKSENKNQRSKGFILTSVKRFDLSRCCFGCITDEIDKQDPLYNSLCAHARAANVLLLCFAFMF